MVIEVVTCYTAAQDQGEEEMDEPFKHLPLIPVELICLCYPGQGCMF